MNKRTIEIVELPYFGFSIVKNSWSFGLEGLLNKEYDIDAYVSSNEKAESLKEVLSNEGTKDLTYTLLNGVGGTGGAGIGALSAGGVVCPVCFPVAAGLAPFAAVPVVLTGGILVSKRYGERKALKKLSEVFNPENAKVEDYSSIESLVNNSGLLQTVQEYKQLINSTKWWQERKSKKVKKKELKHQLNNLASKVLKLPASSKYEENFYSAVAQGYRDYSKIFKKNIFVKPTCYPPLNKAKVLFLAGITAGGLGVGGYFATKYLLSALFGG